MKRLIALAVVTIASQTVAIFAGEPEKFNIQAFLSSLLI